MVNQTKGEHMSENQTGQSNAQGEILIKKYANRKFYDTESSHYVTLAEIQAAVKNGRVIRVIDNVSKKDITNKTLLMSLVETEGEREDLSTADVMALVMKGLSSK
jgi:polyhydroxyalkanoate synthesis repressor PhaR